MYEKQFSNVYYVNPTESKTNQNGYSDAICTRRTSAGHYRDGAAAVRRDNNRRQTPWNGLSTNGGGGGGGGFCVPGYYDRGIRRHRSVATRYLTVTDFHCTFYSRYQSPVVDSWNNNNVNDYDHKP